MQIASIALVLAASLSSCGESQQALDKQKDETAGGEQGNGGGDANPTPPAPTPTPVPTPDPNPNPGDDDDDGTDPGAAYGVTEILATQDDLVKRFNRRPPAEGATVETVKAWTGPGWVYGRLTYKFTAEDGTVKEESTFNKCHAHGTSIGCHRAAEAGPGEPASDGHDDGDHDDGDDHDHDGDGDNDHDDDGDLPPIDDDDLPPIDDELPPIEEAL